MALLDQTLAQIQPVDAGWIRKAEARQLELTKPPGSLGRLEEIANRCAAIFESFAFPVLKPRIVLFAGDHGVCAEGVSPYPQAVTAQMVLNFLGGGAAINCLARTAGIELRVVDAGVAETLPEKEGLVCRKIAAGTRNFCVQPAMSDEEVQSAIQLGIEMADEAVTDGCNLLGFGEMGIGNTTAASALASAVTGLAPSVVIGRGAGADDACLARKISAVERALALHAARLSHPLEMLASIGGLEIAAMCGFCLGAARRRRPMLTDGFIATAGAALAVRMHPAVADYLFAAHGSVEPGHKHLLALIGQRPLLDLQMRLGEGTGAALAMKLVQASASAFMGMATFASVGVSDAEETVVQP
jgi:nicotinate-nucleotide--dimethylbenzimidazole phosphoribosyltransferase